MDLSVDIQYVKGVGPQRAKILQKVGIYTIFDLLTYFPRDYADLTRVKLIAQLQDQESATIQATIVDQKILFTRNRRRILKVVVSDGTGKVHLVCFNQLYLKNTLTKGKTVIIAATFVRTGKKIPLFEATHFTYELLPENHYDLIHTGRIVPVYPITERLNLRSLRSLIYKTLIDYKREFTEYISQEIIQAEKLPPYSWAIERIHFPESHEELRQARRRLVFDEFFLLETALALKYYQKKNQSAGISYSIRKHLLTPFKNLLPFEFTPEQKKAIREIFEDMTSSCPMNRLLQGDVGCGKTIVALCAMLLAVENNYQSVIMAPTEILAEQHYLSLQSYFKELKVEAVLLSSGLTRNQQQEAKESIAAGRAQIIIGTHALLEKDVQFNNLGLVVIDEQHKFGVQQRALLRQKGRNPDVLVMTATPIPRSLSLTVYGDLDVTTVEALPPGRLPVVTLKMNPQEAYKFVKEKVRCGEQAYIVYPLIEESPDFTLKAAKKMAEHLQKDIFPEERVGLLHGKLPMVEKERVMKDFLRHSLDILVATTVIEVGIDVPNATVILIEHAERFGLATLHQLRGRVGRGKKQSYCLLSADEKSLEARKRIQIMQATNDGFKVAQSDLEIRGPGEFFGFRQHGLPELKIGNLLKDIDVLLRARSLSFALVKQDPFLKDPHHKSLKTMMLQKFRDRLHIASVG